MSRALPPISLESIPGYNHTSGGKLALICQMYINSQSPGVRIWTNPPDYVLVVPPSIYAYLLWGEPFRSSKWKEIERNGRRP
jgi:hypothetical protein